jgi:Putative rRNA methylase
MIVRTSALLIAWIQMMVAGALHKNKRNCCPYRQSPLGALRPARAQQRLVNRQWSFFAGDRTNPSSRMCFHAPLRFSSPIFPDSRKGPSLPDFQRRLCHLLGFGKPRSSLLLGANPKERHPDSLRALSYFLTDGALSRMQNTLEFLDDQTPIDDTDAKRGHGNSGVQQFSSRRTIVDAVLDDIRPKATTRADCKYTDTVPPPVELLEQHVGSILPRPSDVNENYGQNPTVAMTALAHSLWLYIIRPHEDVVIDATCGNGYDAVALSKILFGWPNFDCGSSMPVPENSDSARLICIDIQQEACQKTLSALSAVIPRRTLEDRVQILCQSHSPLRAESFPNVQSGSVGLAVYNLGFLPNQPRSHRGATGSNQTEGFKSHSGADSLAHSEPSSSFNATTAAASTIQSLGDAVQLLRVGGMLSVMTYPRSNPQEHEAVRIFVEALALFSSTQRSWEEYIQSEETFEGMRRSLRRLEALSPDSSEEAGIRKTLLESLQQVKRNGCMNQGWRVHEHCKLGWVNAPVLYTATRIR